MPQKNLTAFKSLKNFNTLALAPIHCSFHCKPFPKRQILDSSKLREFADNYFKFDENGRKFSKQVENTAGGKRRNCLFPFPTVFSKD